jgi:hypothetical protein
MVDNPKNRMERGAGAMLGRQDSGVNETQKVMQSAPYISGIPVIPSDTKVRRI